MESLKSELQRERERTEAWVRGRSEALAAREAEVLARAREVVSQGLEVASQEAIKGLADIERARTEADVRARAVGEEERRVRADAARRQVLEILEGVPGMTIRLAKAIASAFPDPGALAAADGKSLLLVPGVTEPLARAVLAAVAPRTGERAARRRATQPKAGARRSPSRKIRPA